MVLLLVRIFISLIETKIKQQILAQTSASHPDFNSLKAAVLEIKRVADFINEKKRQAEARAKVAEIESKLFGDFPVWPLSSILQCFH